MTWQLVFMALTFISAGMAAWLALFAWERRPATGAREIAYLSLALAVWSCAATFELAFDDPDVILTFGKIAYLGITATPVMWFIFAVQCVAQAHHFKQRDLLILSFVPVVTVLSVFTNEYHHLFWQDTQIVQRYGFTLLDKVYGPIFWMWSIYAYSLLLSAVYILRRYLNDDNRQQAMIFMGSLSIPIIGNLIYLAGFSPGLDLTSILFIFGVSIMAWGILRDRVLQYMPLARSHVIDGMRAGIIVLDGAYEVVDVNPAAQWILGMPGNDMVGQSLDTLFTEHPHLQKLFKQLIQLEDYGAPAGEAPLDESFEKSRTFVQMRVTRLKSHKHLVNGYIITLDDVTIRKQAELMAERRYRQLAVLRDIDERMTSTLDIDDVLKIALASALAATLADAAYISLTHGDEQQKIVQVAGRFTIPYIGLIYGHDYGAVGRILRNLQPEFIPDVRYDPNYVNMLPETRAQMAIPLVVHHKLVGLLNLETQRPGHFTPEVFEFAKALGRRIAVAIENARLYTEAQDHLEEQKRLYQQVSRLEQDKTHLIRVAAHDIRNPIGTIMGFLELLRGEAGRIQPEYLEWVDTMMSLARRIDAIITDILSLERVQHGAAFQKVCLQDLIVEMVDLQQSRARQKQLDLRMILPASDICTMGDAAQLKEAITNLISNAIKYTPENGHIEIRLEKLDNSIIFEVIDNGYGIPNDLQGQLFQPFYRAVSSETSQIEGTGLGLHLVKNIVERHKGQLRFHSVYGEGSTFGFELPA